MDFEKEIIEEKEPFDFIEKDPEIFEEPEQEFTKSGTKAVSDPPQYFTNIDGIYAKDVDGRAETAELRTMIDGTYVRAYTVMPVIEQTMLGQIAQYVGTTDSTYTQGYFYIAASDGATEPTYSWVNLPTSPRTYSETVLWEGNLTTAQTEIQLSNAYTNYDEIRIIGRNSGSTTDYIETRQTVSTWGIGEYRGLFTQDNRVWLFPTDATTFNSGSIITIYPQKIIGIKY